MFFNTSIVFNFIFFVGWQLQKYYPCILNERLNDFLIKNVYASFEYNLDYN